MDITTVFDAYQQRGLCMPFGDPVSQRYKSVYMPFQAAGAYLPRIGTPMYFQPDNQLNQGNAIIKGIELIDSTQAQAFIAQGVQRDNITNGQALQSGLFVVSNREREIIAALPLHNLVRRLNAGKLNFTCITDQNWQSCYVIFSNVAGLTDSVGLQFNVYYDTE